MIAISELAIAFPVLSKFLPFKAQASPSRIFLVYGDNRWRKFNPNGLDVAEKTVDNFVAHLHRLHPDCDTISGWHKPDSEHRRELLMSTIIQLSFTLLAILLLAAFVVLLPVAIIFNYKAGMKYREILARQIERLRLGKIIAALGIDIDTYVSMDRTVDIREQITRCKACDNTEECDDRLAEGIIDTDNISFCNNEKSLQELTRAPK